MNPFPTFPYDQAEYEAVSCDLCGSQEQEVFGFSADGNTRAVICRCCGLMFISPRMTREWYERYYQEEYRLRGGVGPDLDVMFEKAKKHGMALAEELRPHLLPKGLLIDVGSGVGGVLAGFREKLTVEVLGIEPSFREAEYAARRGIPTRVALIEDAEHKDLGLPPADQILSAQSLNHFLSPRFFFSYTWRRLKPKGRLILEVKNFRQQARRSGRVWSSIQIDHAYMFTPEMVYAYLVEAGFRILTFLHDEDLTLGEIRARQSRGLPAWQVRAVAEKTEREPFPDAGGGQDEGRYRKIRASLNPLSLFGHYVFRYGGLAEMAQKIYRIRRL